MLSRAVLAAVATAVFATVAPARAATLTPDRLCYLPQQPMTVAGAGWAPGSAWAIGGGLTGSGVADGAGAFAFNTRAPNIPSSTKPKTIRIGATQDGAEVAKASFKVVSFLVVPKNPAGNPAGSTSWSFSGFVPGKQIYFHVQRGKKTYTDKVGKGDKVCGTLKTRLRRLPAVPPKKISFGKYKVFVDNKRRFSKGGLQYRAKIEICRGAC